MRLKTTRDAVDRRLDVWLTEQLRDLSRTRVQSLIKAGRVTIAGKPARPNSTLARDMDIEVDIPPPETPAEVTAEDIPLEILHEDPDIVVVNKPAGLVVHPAAGHSSGTLVNALLHHCNDLAGIGGETRPGLVHRLDKDTSGVLVVAKNERSMRILANQFKNRHVHKEYLAIVGGRPKPASGRIETLIGRSAHDRKKMSTTPASRGRIAVTRYEVVESFGTASLVRLIIETGRTHQIRVHMAHIGHPVAGDRQYGRKRGLDLPSDADRQMLHAEVLSFRHPTRGKTVEFRAPLPADMLRLLGELREDADTPVRQS